MNRCLLILTAMTMTGCAAALVMESNDPRTKIDQATVLFNEQSRPVAAIKLLDQAITLSKEQKNKQAEADAEFYLAEIYKNPLYDMRLADPKKALEHYNRATAIYAELKYFKRAAFVYWNSAAAYEQIGNKKQRCEALRNAEKSHEKQGADPGDLLNADLNEGKLLASIRSLLKQHKCS